MNEQAAEHKELMESWVGKTLLGVFSTAFGVLIIIGTAALNKIDSLRDDVTVIKTTLPYMAKEHEDFKEAFRANDTAHRSFQAQFQELREDNYKHGWGAK